MHINSFKGLTYVHVGLQPLPHVYTCTCVYVYYGGGGQGPPGACENIGEESGRGREGGREEGGRGEKKYLLYIVEGEI